MAEKAGSRKAVTVKRKGGARRRLPAAEEEGLEAFNPQAHELVPKHEKLSEKEAAALMERYHATLRELPKIGSNDPAIRGLGAKQGEIIKITRKSVTAGETIFYRGVVDE
jgi:DNA-directed RNA polymerase subunit H